LPAKAPCNAMAGPSESHAGTYAVCEMVDVAVNTELPLRLLGVIHRKVT
jgi:hypothetical protein